MWAEALYSCSARHSSVLNIVSVSFLVFSWRAYINWTVIFLFHCGFVRKPQTVFCQIPINGIWFLAEFYKTLLLLFLPDFVTKWSFTMATPDNPKNIRDLHKMNIQSLREVTSCLPFTSFRQVRLENKWSKTFRVFPVENFREQRNFRKWSPVLRGRNASNNKRNFEKKKTAWSYNNPHVDARLLPVRLFT